MQAWRRIVAAGSRTFSFWALAVTVRFSIGTTPMIAKMAPAGFQHWEQPQAWLCNTFPLMVTSTLS